MPKTRRFEFFGAVDYIINQLADLLNVGVLPA